MMKAILFVSLIASIYASFNPEEYVNILGGTDSSRTLSHGGTLPLIGRPWGFNTWAPYTSPGNSGWWFEPNERSFYGMRLTHQPSPWIGDYGSFIVKAEVTSTATVGDANQYSGYSPSKAIFHPYYFKAALLAYGTANGDTTMEFSPSRHGGIMRLQFPAFVEDPSDTGYSQNRRIAIILNGGEDQSTVVLPSSSTQFDTVTITGVSTQNSGGVSPNFGHYFVASIYSGPDGNTPILNVSKSSAGSNSAVVDFSPLFAAHDTLTVRIGTSFISLEQAILNQKEVGVGKSFDDIVKDAKDEWNQVLSRALLVDVGKGYSDEQVKDLYTTFYSCLYRASLFPRQITEIDGSGKEVHWSPFDGAGALYDGPLSTDSGFWDAYNTIYPYLSIVNRPVLGNMIQGWVNGYKEGGWLPKWASPGYRSSMVGSMGDVSLADAIVKKIPGFDVNAAYDSLYKDAMEIPPKGVIGIGRTCLEAYQKYGYLPKGSPQTTGGSCDEVVSQSLNYMQADFAIAKAAEALGHSEDADYFLKRALNYGMLFDNSTYFFRSRDVINQQFSETFDQFAWGGDYTEGGPWQFKFYVPHDPKGLSSLYKSVGEDLCQHLQSAQTQKSTFHIGAYGTEIHEETEMPDGCWGQYAHNNQPVHHMLYMFVASDEAGYNGACASHGQYWLRKATSSLYKPTADMFAGDEDNGEMGAWYILSSIGLYGLNPGTEDYVLGSPLFARVEIDLSEPSQQRSQKLGMSAPKLVVIARNQAPDHVYVQKVSWNGIEIPKNSVSVRYSEIMKGGELVFEMGPKPAML